MTDKQSLIVSWIEYIGVALKYRETRRDLFSKYIYSKNYRADELIDLLKESLSKPTEESDIALDVIACLPDINAKKELFDYLFPYAIELETKSPFNQAEQIILSLPKEWLIIKLQEKAEEVLKSKSPEITSGMLNIYSAIDRTTAKRLAQKALENPDEYSKDIGKHFLAELEVEPKI
jgi:hypothetical protein